MGPGGEEGLTGALQKEKKLSSLLAGWKGAIVAFSGGVDSTYLLHKAEQAWGPERVLAVTAVSPLLPEEEIEEAKKTAGFLGVKHLALPFEIMSREGFLLNTRRRCYYCKYELFNRLLELGQKHGLPVVLEGSNQDDLKEYRPGLIAAREWGIKSPLLEVGLTKQEIRQLSRRWGLPTWNRNASPCLATRFPYGERVNLEKLQRVARAERFFRQLGFERELRVRCHGTLARIEVPVSEQSKVLAQGEIIAGFLKEVGFQYIALDLQGFVSGNMNRPGHELPE